MAQLISGRSMIRTLTQARFEALCFSREPTVKLYSEEREWYADRDENVLGILVFDKVDADWTYLVLGRDELAKFSAIACEVSISNADQARKDLHHKMEELSASGQKIFPQGHKLKGKKVFELFNPVVPPSKQHRNFVQLTQNVGFSPAKELIAEIAYTFEDPDGNYIQQFQGKGFDARLWELYLYAVLHQNDFSLNRDYHAPDYACSKFGFPLMLEATTVNPTEDRDNIETSELDPDGIEMADYMSIKFANALYSKLDKRYWELNHVKGKSLIFAVAHLQKPEGIYYSAKFLQEYLYGQRQTTAGNSYVFTPIKEHVYRDRRKPSGFFSLPGSENVSAVLFSDAGTLSKFNRMGKLAEFGNPDVRMIRFGQRYETSGSQNATEFKVLVQPPNYTETWSEGIYLFHNPAAKYPILPELFPDASHTTMKNGRYAIYVPDRFPIWSKTVIVKGK